MLPQTPPKKLIVARDRAHVKTLVAKHPDADVISASAFFDKVRYFAFVAHENLRRDDFAVVVAAQQILPRHPQFGIRYVTNFCSLYAAFYHGTSRPVDVYHSLTPEHIHLAPVIAVLADMDEFLTTQGLVTGVSALFHAWELLKALSSLPASLRCYDSVELVYLVDLTLLEIEVIKELSRRGLRIEVRFPMDFQRRGLNAAVDFSAKQFERADDLWNVDLIFDNLAHDGPLSALTEALFNDDSHVSLSSSMCTIEHAPDLLTEADNLASSVANMLALRSDESIAVAVRTMDARAHIFKRALTRYGIGVRDRKGTPIIATKAGLLLESILSARMNHLAKRDLISLMSNPLFSLHVPEQKTRADFIRLLSEIGIDDRVTLPKDGHQRYRSNIAAFGAKLTEDDIRKENLSQFEQWLHSVQTLLASLHDRCSLHKHLQVVRELTLSWSADEPTVGALKETIEQLLKSPAFLSCDGELTLRDFSHLLKSHLAGITIPQPDNANVRAVEFLLLPELLGRQFDHVFIVDIAFGRVPFSSSSDPLLDDHARILLNQHLKKPFLRVFFDDPFEPLPVPPRQALEPFWFACAISSAQQSVHFSCARMDENGQELAPSEFFLWLYDHVTLTGDRRERKQFSSPEHLSFLRGVRDAALPDAPSLIKRAHDQRMHAFRDGEPSEFAFFFGTLLRDRFAGRLDDEPTRALTPTMVEGFSSCRFKGMLERIVSMNAHATDADDVDARGIGQIGHRALELFFLHNKHTDREKKSTLLRTILSSVGEEFTQQNFVANELVLACHLEWLHDALLSLITTMEEQGMRQSQTLAQEIALGLGTKNPLSLEMAGRKYKIGGRIDRIDRTHEGFLVADYKLSTVSALRSELTSQTVLRRHFQMPIYVRLVSENFAQGQPVEFVFASIRDGALMPTISARTHPELFERIFDRAEDNLTQAIDHIFAPMRRGEALAVVGEHCSSCAYTFLCRRSGVQHAG